MNFTETIKSGQHYRVFDKLNNDGTRHYNRYSFVTNAADVIFEDGTNVEEKLGGSSGSLAAINKEIADLKKSVSDGKKAVAAAVTANGVTTATDAAFSVIANNINTAAANKYNAGIAYADGRVNTDSANYKSGYSTGHAVGYKDAQDKFGTAASIFLRYDYYSKDYSEITVDLTNINRIKTEHISGAAGSTWSSSMEEDFYFHTHYYFYIDNVQYWYNDDQYSGWSIESNSPHIMDLDVSKMTGYHTLRVFSECDTAEPDGRPSNPGAADYYLNCFVLL